MISLAVKINVHSSEFDWDDRHFVVVGGRASLRTWPIWGGWTLIDTCCAVIVTTTIVPCCAWRRDGGDGVHPGRRRNVRRFWRIRRSWGVCEVAKKEVE